MPKNLETLNSSLFELLRSRGYEPTMLGTDGKEIPVPEEADVFQFKFKKDGEDYGPVTLSIDGTHKLVVYFGDNIANSPSDEMHTGDTSWYTLLNHLKRFSHKHQLSFEVKNTDHLKYDMAKRTHMKKVDESAGQATSKAADFNRRKEQKVAEGRMTHGPGGVPLDRQGNTKVAKPRVSKTSWMDYEDEPKPELDYDKIWYDVTNIIGNIFPDGDPADYLPKYCRKHGITYDDIRVAAKKNGYEDEYAYIDDLKTGDYGYNESTERVTHKPINLYHKKGGFIGTTNVSPSKEHAIAAAERTYRLRPGSVIAKYDRPVKQGVAEGLEQVYKIVAVNKSDALKKPTKLTVKAGSIEEVFERLAVNDWYPLEINGVEVINGKRLKQGVAEAAPVNTTPEFTRYVYSKLRKNFSDLAQVEDLFDYAYLADVNLGAISDAMEENGTSAKQELKERLTWLLKNMNDRKYLSVIKPIAVEWMKLVAPTLGQQGVAEAEYNPDTFVGKKGTYKGYGITQEGPSQWGISSSARKFPTLNAAKRHIDKNLVAEQGVAEGFNELDDGTNVVAIQKLSDSELMRHYQDFKKSALMTNDKQHHYALQHLANEIKRRKQGVAEAEKNPHTSALGKALYRDLSKEKKASPAQVEKNKANWAKNPHNPANKEQGVAEGLADDFAAMAKGMKNKDGTPRFANVRQGAAPIKPATTKPAGSPKPAGPAATSPADWYNQASGGRRYTGDSKEPKGKMVEGYYATGKRSSYSDAVPQVKIILQHNRQLEEGERRYRAIDRIFVENAAGERFLLDTNKPGLARVYARHIAEGGTPYDEQGKHIHSLVEEYTKMAGFVRATRNGQFNESTQSLVSEGINHYQKLRETLHKMAGARGYHAYFESYTPALMEDEDTTDLSEMFASNALDPRIESVMPILRKLNKSLAEMVETTDLGKWADDLISEALDEQEIQETEYGQARHGEQEWRESPKTPTPALPASKPWSLVLNGKVIGTDKNVAVLRALQQKRGGKIVRQGEVAEDIQIEEDDGLVSNNPQGIPESGGAPWAANTKKAMIASKKAQQTRSPSDHAKAAAAHSHAASDPWHPDKEFHQEQAAKHSKLGGVKEGLDANQKAAGQLGPQEKVGPQGAVGKLVGANESADPLNRIKYLLGK